MRAQHAGWIVFAAALFGSCTSGRAPQPLWKLTVAAAANLTDVFAEVGRAFKAKTDIEVIFSYGSSAADRQRRSIRSFRRSRHGALDALVKSRKVVGSRAMYAL